jgi:hypothetical protein
MTDAQKPFIPSAPENQNQQLTSNPQKRVWGTPDIFDLDVDKTTSGSNAFIEASTSVGNLS